MTTVAEIEVSELTQNPAWLRIKTAATELQPLQSANGGKLVWKVEGDRLHAQPIEVGLASGERVWLSRDRTKDKLWKLREMLKEARRQGLALATYDMTVDRNYVGRSAEAEPAP